MRGMDPRHIPPGRLPRGVAMSMHHLAEAWAVPSVKGSQLIVLLALADASDGMGQCRIAVSQLARKSRLTQEQTNRVIDELVQAGHLSVVDATDALLCSYQLLNLNPGQNTEGGPA